jgi:hypothetical protein
MYGGYLRLLPPLKLVAMILLKVALNTKNEINHHYIYIYITPREALNTINSKHQTG